MVFRHMVSMERSLEEKAMERAENTYPQPLDDMPNVPSGCCICLTETELEKLGIEDNAEVGDMIHLVAMGKVTAVSRTDTGSGQKSRTEIALVSMSVENEDQEEPGED